MEDWKFWIADIGIPLFTFFVGLFTGKTIEKKNNAKAKVKGSNNTVIQNNEYK